MKTETPTGGRLLVDALLTHGVRTLFGVPGESYLPVLDALFDSRDDIRFIVCRQEGGAGYMAEAHGKLTGEPGVCLVTRGPGAANASIALHTAYQDSTPLILLVGQVGSDFVEREAFQEIDYRRMFGPVAKWVAQIDRADRIGEFVSRAFHIATSGRAGPVVLSLPEDMLASTTSQHTALARYQRVEANPSVWDVERMLGMLAKAERPIALLGGGGWTTGAADVFREFAERSGLPVACAFRSQDLFDNCHRCYIGDTGPAVNPKLAKRVKEADLLLVVGARMDEMTTSGYTLVTSPKPAQKLIHVHAGADELGRVFQGQLLINSGMASFCQALDGKAVPGSRWQSWLAAARAEYEEWTCENSNEGAVQISAIITTLQSAIPKDSIVTNGAGNYAGWLHRFFRYSMHRTQLAPQNGSMGYGVPAAVAAKLEYPKRTVVALSGDGCFLMNGQELATACQYGANIVIVLLNNGMYGTIRLHQEKNYPGRVMGTELINPDFAEYARAFGAHGEVVESNAEFLPALKRCLEKNIPSLIEVRIDPNALSHQASLENIRTEAYRRLQLQ